MTAPINPKAQLSAAGLRPKHQFGQNFLADAQICQRIAEIASPPGTCSTVEIGAGLGALTAPLLERCGNVVAIERDRDLVPELSARFRVEVADARLTVVEQDAKDFDYVSCFAQLPQPATLAGNLPYQITGPLLRRSLEVATLVSRCAFLVQLEVAERLTAEPGSSDYGALSVFLQARFRISRELVVRRGAFYPQPNVDSAVVLFLPLQEPVTDETPLFRALVKSAFGQRRKKLRNAWAAVETATNSQVARAAAQAEIDLDRRGETLSVRDFARMTRTLSNVLTTTEGTNP